MNERLDRELERLDCSAALILGSGSGDADLACFTGAVKLGEAFVVARRGRPPRLAYFTPMERDEAASTGLALLSPEELDLARLAQLHPDPGEFLAAALAVGLERSGVSPGRLALAGSGPAGTLSLVCTRLESAGWSILPGNEALRRVRKRKRVAELAETRRVAGATGEAMAVVARLLAAASVRDGVLELEGEPLRVARLKREVARVFSDHELSQPRGNIIAPGEEGGVPHTAGTLERVLRSGESLVVDLFPKGWLFADATRTFCVGEASEALARAYADVAGALALAHRETGPGVRGWDLQQVVCAHFGARGWPTPVTDPAAVRGYVHGLGHGVGLELHEYPSFRRAAAEEGVLETGDVLTLEPGLYEPGTGGFGVRLEDLVWLGPEGAENLTPWSCDLDPRAFRVSA